MKKLYRRGTVHPSSPITAADLYFLPAAISTLATALSPEDKEVLAYLISCSNNDFGNFSTHKNKNTQKHPATKIISFNTGSDHDHPPLFTCDCFRCYTSYWVRWDSSPNRQLIHEIIDAFEDGLAQNKNTKIKRDKKKKKGRVDDGSGGSKRTGSSLRSESSELNSVEASSGEVCGDDGEEEGTDKGTVRRFVNFIGERIWNVLAFWGSESKKKGDFF